MSSKVENSNKRKGTESEHTQWFILNQKGNKAPFIISFSLSGPTPIGFYYK